MKRAFVKNAPYKTPAIAETPRVKSGPSPFLPFKNLDSAAEIAYYYGFMPIETPHITKEDSLLSKKILDAEIPGKNFGKDPTCSLSVSAEEKTALLRTCVEKNLISPTAPAMLYYEGEPQKEGLPKRSSSTTKRYSLDIIGTTKSVAEAELIKAAIEILREEGFEDLYVDLNSIGDKDSLAKFAKELSGYFRKNVATLEAHCRQNMKKDIFTLLECENGKCQENYQSAPKSISFLTEPSRVHFKEVLEYLESMNVPYKINSGLIGNRKLCCHTVFLIRTLNAAKPGSEEETLALGFRYSGLAKKLEMKKDLPAVGITIMFKRERGTANKKSHNPKKPKAYFIQFGQDAKRKSLEVIEILRKEKIPLHQALAKDKLTSQIAIAENMGIPYVLIMGQREAIENSVIVRNMKTRFQETVKIPNLSDYIRKLTF